MSIADLVGRGRAAAEAMMTSTCLITRDNPDAEKVFDDVTGEYAPVVPLVVYAGPCKVQENRVQVRDATSADLSLGIINQELHLPVDGPGSGNVRRNDDVTVTADTFDASLPGRVFVVRGPHAGSQKTARRLPVEEVL